MALVSGGKKDPAAELRAALISALVDVPFMNALPDRRLLINLIRRDVERPSCPIEVRSRPRGWMCPTSCVRCAARATAMPRRA